MQKKFDLVFKDDKIKSVVKPSLILAPSQKYKF